MMTPFPRIIVEVDPGGGTETDVIGDTMHNDNLVESSIRELHIYTAFNYTQNSAHVKTVVKWITLPNDRFDDLISISHNNTDWYIDYYLENGTQVELFVGKQIYSTVDYYAELGESPSGPAINEVYSNEDTHYNYYDEDDIDLYNHDFSEGLVLKQKLEEDDIHIHAEPDGLGAIIYYELSTLVTALELSVEADFNYNGVPAPNSFGTFIGAMKHQEIQWNFSWDEVYVSAIPPYISVPTGLLWFQNKYDDGLSVSVNLPLD